MRRKLRNAVLRGKIYSVDLYDGIGGMVRFHVQATEEKAALHAALRMVINNKYYKVSEIADPTLDEVVD